MEGDDGLTRHAAPSHPNRVDVDPRYFDGPRPDEYHDLGSDSAATVDPPDDRPVNIYDSDITESMSWTYGTGRKMGFDKVRRPEPLDIDGDGGGGG